MPSPEHIVHQPRVVFEPNKTGSGANDPRASEDTQQDFLPRKEQEIVEAAQLPLHELYERIPLSPYESEDLGWAPDTIGTPIPTDIQFFDAKGVKWQEDLSPDGQWLFELLLSGGNEELGYLQAYAKEQQVNLQAAVAELNAYGFLEKRKSGWIDIAYSKLPSQQKTNKSSPLSHLLLSLLTASSSIRRNSANPWGGLGILSIKS